MVRTARLLICAICSLTLLLGGVALAAAQPCVHGTEQAPPAKSCPCCDHAILMAAACATGCQPGLSRVLPDLKPSHGSTAISYVPADSKFAGLERKPPVPPPR
jgi:hypothetical protein